MPTIIFNGKTYNSLEEMPANERQAFESVNNIFADKDGNGIPDIFEGNISNSFMRMSGGNVSFNGKTYNTAYEMPPEMREKIQSAFKMMADMGLVQQSASVNVSEFKASTPIRQSPSPIANQPSVIEEEKSGSPFIWVILGILLCFIVLVGGFAVVYLLQR